MTCSINGFCRPVMIKVCVPHVLTSEGRQRWFFSCLWRFQLQNTIGFLVFLHVHSNAQILFACLCIPPHKPRIYTVLFSYLFIVDKHSLQRYPPSKDWKSISIKKHKDDCSDSAAHQNISVMTALSSLVLVSMFSILESLPQWI